MTPALIIAAIDAAMQLIALALKASEDLKQSGEMTQAESDALDAKIAALSQQPWWKPEGA